MNGRERPEGRINGGNQGLRVVGWWLRLIAAGGALAFAGLVVGRSFLDHIAQMRNSPAALVLLVLVIQLAWFISHAPAGGVVASLKIVLGGCALVAALLGPASQYADWPGVDSRFNLPVIGAALLAIWVVADGVMDRRANLRRGLGREPVRPTAGISVEENPSPPAITTGSRRSDA